jgi:hypothetical protein
LRESRVRSPETIDTHTIFPHAPGLGPTKNSGGAAAITAANNEKIAAITAGKTNISEAVSATFLQQ